LLTASQANYRQIREEFTLPIEFRCTECGTMLRVDESNRGKMARCPKCSMINAIPGPSVAEPNEPYEAWPQRVESPPPAYLPKDAELWSMRGVDGTVYGPVRLEELQRWYGEGRINNHCQVQRVGDTNWRPALDVVAGGIDLGETKYHTPASPMIEHAGRLYSPHNGPTILVLACIGTIVFPCALIAWIMGHYELKKIRQGLVDPSGESLVRAGYVIGIIFTILGVLPWICCCFSPLAAIPIRD
jgi:hypothetical protein